MQAQIDAIKAKVAQCIALAEKTFGVTMPNVQVRFDLTGRAAGVAGMRYGAFYLRFNTKHMALGGKTWEHLINDTVPHEVAHTVCQAFPRFGNNHNDGWKRVCVALGGNGRRTYSEADAPEAIAAMRPYVYVTTNGNTVRVTKVIHSKVQRGASYSYKGGKGSINKQCQYSYMTAPTVAATRKPVVVVGTIGHTVPVGGIGPMTKPAPVQRVAVAAKGSNAEQLRAYLRTAKADHGSSAQERTVQWAVATLGMKSALARTYVKNNWMKV